MSITFVVAFPVAAHSLHGCNSRGVERGWYGVRVLCKERIPFPIQMPIYMGEKAPGEPPPRDTSPTNPFWIRGLRYPVPLLPSGRGTRAGYVLSCVAAGIAGSPVLGLSGGLFLLLSAAAEAPTSIAMAIACFVASLIDLSGDFVANTEGNQFLVGDAPGFLVFISTAILTTFIDDDVELSLPKGVDTAVDRVKQVKRAELERADREARARLRRHLGMDESNSAGISSSEEGRATLKEWDSNFEEEKK